MFLVSIHETVPKKTQARATEDNGFVIIPRVQIESVPSEISMEHCIFLEKGVVTFSAPRI
jgi:hypothetical protein